MNKEHEQALDELKRILEKPLAGADIVSITGSPQSRAWTSMKVGEWINDVVGDTDLEIVVALMAVK